MKLMQPVRKVYLDVCVLSRPFDDQSHMRIRLETDALYLILDKIQKGRYKLITSPVHFREIEDIEDIEERFQLLGVLSKFSARSSYDMDQAMMRTEELVTKGFGLADAAHVAFAEQVADAFISCDDRLLRKCEASVLKIKTMNPIEFCEEERLR